MSIEDHFGIDVGRVDLVDELSASSTRRQHMQDSFVAPPHRDDLLDPVLAGRDHCGDGTVLRAEPRTRFGVDADTRVTVALVGDERRSYVSEETTSNNMWVEYGLRQADQFVV